MIIDGEDMHVMTLCKVLHEGIRANGQSVRAYRIGYRWRDDQD
jgi:hypothetical protein